MGVNNCKQKSMDFDLNCFEFEKIEKSFSDVIDMKGLIECFCKLDEGDRVPFFNDTSIIE